MADLLWPCQFRWKLTKTASGASGSSKRFDLKLKILLAVRIKGNLLGSLSLQKKGQRLVEFVIRGGGNSAIICFHSSVSGPQVR